MSGELHIEGYYRDRDYPHPRNRGGETSALSAQGVQFTLEPVGEITCGLCFDLHDLPAPTSITISRQSYRAMRRPLRYKPSFIAHRP